jgi:citrate lyase subunit beta / citryl-CoA lyase
MRSYLFVPGDTDRKLENAPSSGADCLLIDLEDSVSPRRKIEARTMAAAFLHGADRGEGQPKLIVRINALDSGHAEADLDAVVGAKPDGILLPKAEGPAAIQHLSALIAVREAENDIPEGQLRIHALAAETAAGVLNLNGYRGASARLEALSWGGEDLAADLGAARNRGDDGHYTDVFRLARSMTLLAAAAAQIMAIDTVFTDFRDMEGLERECLAAERDGFSGKLAIHPAQVEVINRVFTPSSEAVHRARRIVELFEGAGEDAGVMSLEGRMIDRPHLRQAERILKRAAAAGVSA